MNHPIHRRAVLRGLLYGSAVTIGLPALEIFTDRTRRALAGDGFPKRFGLFFWGNGNIPGPLWNPATTGADWAPPVQLELLAEIKHKVTVVTGLAVKLTNLVPHGTGSGAILSGAPLLVRGTDHTFSEPSIDQVIARAIGQESRFKSIEVGVRPGPGLSHNGPSSVNPPEREPARVFDRIFGGGFRAPGSEAQVDPKLRLRRSVLDVVARDAQRLHTRLGAADRTRLDQHLTGIRELESRIAHLEEDPPALAACAMPAAPPGSYPDVEGRPPLDQISDAMGDLVAMALACDQTRVFSFYFSAPLSNELYFDAPAGHHQLTHDEPEDQPIVIRIVRLIIGALARLLKKLDAIGEGGGTLLDHCAILGTSDVSHGRTHSIENYPVLIAGGACGALRPGLHVSVPEENISRVSLSLLRAVGVPAAEFGKEAGHVTQGLSEIEA